MSGDRTRKRRSKTPSPAEASKASLDEAVRTRRVVDVTGEAVEKGLAFVILGGRPLEASPMGDRERADQALADEEPDESGDRGVATD